MARIPYPDPATLSAETQEQLGKLPPLNLFRMLAGGEGLLKAFVKFGNHLWFKTELPPTLREIAILRVGVLCQARYEVFQHERIARGLGMSDELIEAIRQGPEAAAFSDVQRLVMRFTDDVVRNVRASDETFRPVVDRLSLRQAQELILTIGYYMTVSRFLETFEVDIETTGR